jgi:hypothetical protein
MIVACTGPQGAVGMPGPAGAQGPAGSKGDPGSPGAGTPSVSTITPSYGYLGRTIDLAIAGSDTAWSGTTTVTFADPQVTVNKVTAASATGLLVNVTIGQGATLAPTDVTVTDGATTEVYKGAFELRSPLQVTIAPPAGLVQGGFASVNARMLDVTTPFDPQRIKVTFGNAAVAIQTAPQGSDYSLDFTVEADVLAPVGAMDLLITSGPGATAVASPGKKAFPVQARTPSTLMAGMGVTSMVATPQDSSLYTFTSATAGARFVQFGVSSADKGGPEGIALPKSGKIADALSLFPARFALGTTSTDPFYLIVIDGGGPAAKAPPYGVDTSVSDTPCTAFTAPTTTHGTTATAYAVTTLPALVRGDLGNGTDAQGDWYSFTVPGSATQIHAATGGDGLSDTLITIADATGTSLQSSTPDDFHKDLVYDVSAAGTYYVQITTDFNFLPAHSKYDLFIEVK